MRALNLEQRHVNLNDHSTVNGTYWEHRPCMHIIVRLYVRPGKIRPLLGEHHNLSLFVEAYRYIHYSFSYSVCVTVQYMKI